MKDVVIFFDLFDTLIKVDRGYLEEYFDEELDKMGDLGTLKDAKSTIEQIVSKHPEVLEKHSLEEMTTYYEKIMSDSLMNVEPGILVMLQQLKEAGYKMCIVSDATFVDIKDYKKSPLFKYFYYLHSCPQLLHLFKSANIPLIIRISSLPQEEQISLYSFTSSILKMLISKST